MIVWYSQVSFFLVVFQVSAISSLCVLLFLCGYQVLNSLTYSIVKSVISY